MIYEDFMHPRWCRIASVNSMMIEVIQLQSAFCANKNAKLVLNSHQFWHLLNDPHSRYGILTYIRVVSEVNVGKCVIH